MVSFRPEQPADRPAIETLLDFAFGPDRHGKASYAFRRSAAPVHDLCRVAVDAGRLVGTIRYWPIRVDDTPALLLGPVGVDPQRRGEGIGRRLIDATLADAAATIPVAVFLVGDLAYYGRHGFVPAAPAVTMPHENPARLLGRLPDADALWPSGPIRPADVPRMAAEGPGGGCRPTPISASFLA